MAWENELSELKGAGFSDLEIGAEAARIREEMSAAGFGEDEVKTYFGEKELDTTPIKNFLTANLNMKAEEYKAMAAEGKQVPEVADTFIEALDAGFQQSSGRMLSQALKGKRVTPDMLLPEDAGTFFRIASQVGTIAGDLPAMAAGTVIGAVGGGAVGSSVPVVGTAAGAVIGGGAGGNALPTAIRQILIEGYEKGEVQNFEDFWERTSAVFINTSKDAVIGGATAGVGGKVLSAASKVAAPTAARIASTGSEIATMVAVGKSFEGEVPKAQDFLDAALLVGGLHVASSTAGKLRQIYSKTGQTPAQVLQEADTNPILKQELLMNNDETPSLYQSLDETRDPWMNKDVWLDSSKENKAAPEATPVSEPTAKDKILNKVGTVAEQDKPGYTANDFYKDYVDRLDPIKRAVKELADGDNPDTIDNAYDLSRMAGDAPAKAKHFLEAGTLDYKTLEKNGASLNDILNPIKDDLDGFTAYIVSKRALELEGRGIKSGFDTEAAKTVVAEGAAKFDAAAKELVEFQNRALQYLKDSGVLSPEAFNRIKDAGKDYVSFKRIMEDGQASGGSKKNPIKRIKGSDKDIQDPLISLVDNVELYLKTAEINRAKVALIEQGSKKENNTLFEKVDIPQRPVQVSSKEVTKALEKQGIEIDDPAGVEAFSVFRKQDRPLAKDEFEVYRNGKREVYKTKEPALAEALNSLDGNATSQNIVINIMRTISTVKRIGISLTPDFIARNIFRDQITSGVFSKSGSFNFLDIITAATDIVKKNDNYYNWLKAGGANGAFIKLDELYFKDNAFKINEETGFMNRAWNVIKSPKESIEMMANLAEQSTRLAEAKRIQNGATSGPDIFRSGMGSREITVDFQRIGAKMSAFNAITAFQNAQIQGFDRTLRAIKSDPKGILIKGGAMLTAPSVLLWWANKDDERVKEIPRWQKDLHWIIPTDSWEKEAVPGEAANLPSYLVREGKDGSLEINRGVIYRLPKPQELGILFGSLPERILDGFFTDNPDAFKDFEDTLLGMITPSFVPDVAAPVIEQAFNKSLFTGGKIVPGPVEEVLPQYQYSDYTSETAKALGKLIPYVPMINDIGPKNSPLASPAVLENYWRSWTGSIGGYALNLLDAAGKKAGVYDNDVEAPAWKVADIPFVKAFTIKNPSMSAQSIKEFYERFDSNNRVIKTVEMLGKAGDGEEAQKVIETPDYQKRMADLGDMKSAISNMSQAIRMIKKDPNMKAEEKTQLIDGLYYSMIEVAKSGNNAAKDFEKQTEIAIKEREQ